MIFDSFNLKAVAVTIVAATFVMGCGPKIEPEPVPEPEPEPQKVEVRSVSLNQTSISLETTDCYQLEATVNPLNADDPTVTWSSSDAGVASVSQEGLVTALTAGTAKITAKAGAKSAVCKVTVSTKIYHVTEVSLDKTALELTEGDKATLTATVGPDNATNPSVNWSVDDPTVLSIAPNGNSLSLEALKAGTATVIVSTTDGGKIASCKVTVKSAIVPVRSISLDKTTLGLVEGDKATLTATIQPSDASDQSVTWSVDKPDVLTITANGKNLSIEAKAAGEAIITVTSTDGGFSASCKVSVSSAYYPVVSVSLDKESYSLAPDATFSLTATINPSNATNPSLTWSIDNTHVAQLSSTEGASITVTGKNEGTATVTVTSIDGSKTATCTIKVSADGLGTGGDVNYGEDDYGKFN